MRSAFCSRKECRLSLPLSRDDCEDALEQFFVGHETSRQIFDALRDAIDAIGPAELRVTRSQIAFRHLSLIEDRRRIRQMFSLTVKTFRCKIAV
jgi:hypothetical protein